VAVKKPTALGVHIYAGGFTLGVLKHFNVLAHFEEWRFGVDTVRNNLKLDVHVDQPAGWPIKDYAGRVQFVFANPPCAPWSQLRGKDGADWRTNPQVEHWLHCLDLLDRLKPDVLACESVRGVYKRGREMLDPRIAAASKRGYRATHVLCNALEHGVPQSRPRYFLILSKYDLPWKPTGLKRDATIADAWKGGFKTETQVKRSKTAEKWIKKTRPGDDLRRTFNLHVQPDDMQHGTNGRVVGRPPFAWKRLRKEGLSHVITGGPNFVHNTKNRFLTVEEQAALCGYPKWYKFSGSPSAQYPQIGKAVMPPVAEYIARIVAEALKKKKKPPVLIPEQVTIWRDKIEREDSDMLHMKSGFKVAQRS
jgi:DNA (cytosine-5)-methyltransferase 1